MKDGTGGLPALMLCASIGFGLGIGPAAAETSQKAESFRVLSTIVDDKAEEPLAKHLVLFHEDLVYDISQINDARYTVYDLKRKRVILLDRPTQVRTTIPTEKLLELTAKLRSEAVTEQAKKQLGIDAAVDRDDNLTTYSVRYGSIQYETSTQVPTRGEIAKQYGRFADLASQLDIAQAVGMPPIGRMKMNRQIAADGRVPLETTLTIHRIGHRDQFRSTHELIERISHSDRTLIDEVGGMLALYREVELKRLSRVTSANPSIISSFSFLPSRLRVV